MSTKMDLAVIALALIDADFAENSRQDIGDVADLQASIKENGQQTPIAVQKVKGGRYKLVSGFRRFTAMTALGLDTVSATVYPENLRANHRRLYNLMENVARKALNPMDEAQAAKRLMDDGVSSEDIQGALCWTPTLLTQRLNLLGLSEPLQSSIRDMAITVQQANAIAQAPEESHPKLIEMAKQHTVARLRDEIEKLNGKAAAPVTLAGGEPATPDDGAEPAAPADGAEKSEKAEKAEKVDVQAVAGQLTERILDLVIGVIEDSDIAQKAVIKAQSIPWTDLGAKAVQAAMDLFTDIANAAGVLGNFAAAMPEPENEPQVD